MTLTARLAAFSGALVLLTTGCTGQDEPTDVARTGSTSDSPTGAAESPTASDSEEPAPVVFHGGSAVTVSARCGNPAPTYVTLHEEFQVNREVRLGEVTPVGAGRLVGPVFVAPTTARGSNDGALVVDERPGFGGVDHVPAWRDRVALQGRLVQPATYAAFAQVRLRPGTRLQALDVSYFDSNTTGSARLAVSASVVRKCRD